MNQILMVQIPNKKNKNSGPIVIKSIVRFFAIVLIIFGISLIGQGSYGIHKVKIGSNTENIPQISITRINDKIILNVNGVNKITNLKYTWNNAQETIIPVEGTNWEEEIMLPIEDSELKVAIEEESGRVVRYSKNFELTGVDLQEPTIEIVEEGNQGSIRINATDDTEMLYITYKVNDEDEIKIEKSASEKETINYVLKLEKGENVVKVKAVDKSGNVSNTEKKILVTGRTEILTPIIRGGKLIIRIKDPDGIKDIEINLNGKVYSKNDINQKEIEVKLDIPEGRRTLKIKVTNVNSFVTEGTGEF